MNYYSSAFNKADWYWVVGEDETQVWSSATMSYIPQNTPAYVSWLSTGNFPIRIATKENMDTIISNLTSGGSVIFRQARKYLNEGITITSTSDGWTSTFSVTTEPFGDSIWATLTREQEAINASSVTGNTTFADGSNSLHWPDINNTLRTLSPAQFIAFKTAIGTFVSKIRSFAHSVPGATLPPNQVTII